MRLKVVISLFTVFISFSGNLFSQTYDRPNIGLKWPETLEILKVDVTSENTVIYLSVENRIEGGTFCADRNIYILDSEGKKHMLLRSSGIPVCPDSHKFKKTGEKLSFTLTFPALGAGCNWIDLIEDCSENCFSMYGVILDNKLNRIIDESFVFAENNEPVKAMLGFIKIAETDGLRNKGAAGLLYINIISLARETGNAAKATEWNNKLRSSAIPRVTQYINFINGQQ